MDRIVTFTVAGRPSRWMRPGQAIHHGKIVRITDPKAAAEKKVIAQLARLAWRGPPVCGPVVLQVRGIFKIPASWPAALKAEANACRVPHIQDPDLDQLVKQVMDALVGIVFWDDNQVVGFARSAKRYGSPERTEITVQVLEQSDAAKTPGQRDLERAAGTGQMIAGKARPRATASRSKSGSRGRS